MNSYLPEGQLLHTPENYEALCNRSAMEKAMETGKIVEAFAVLCNGDFSLEVDLGKGMRGIIPREEVQYSPKNEPVKDIAILTRVGKAVCFKICGFAEDENGTVVMLSRRMAQKECSEIYIAALQPGDVIPAKVTHMEPFGAFMDIGCGIVSLLTVDAISISRISHPKDRFRIGDTMDTVVRAIDEEGRIFVSRRELLGTWEENAALFSPGQTVSGIVRSVESYGIFVELTPNLAGLAELKPNVEVGDTAAVFIKSILPDKMKIKLVIIDVHPEKRRREENRLRLPETTVRHLSAWRYSPPGCGKIVETKFDDASCIS